jgi:hypothetical protein
MTALSSYRDTKRMGDDVIPTVFDLLVADNVHLFKGAIVGLAGGYAAPAGATCSKVVGISRVRGGQHAARPRGRGEARSGCARARSRSPTAPPRTRWRSPTSGTSATRRTTRPSPRPRGPTCPVAGTVLGVDPDGVWVQMNLDGRS